MSLLPLSTLKEELHKQHSAENKLLMLLASFDQPTSVKELVTRANEAGFRVPRTWNVSSILQRSKGRAVRTPQGWELQKTGAAALQSIGVDVGRKSTTHEVATELRILIERIDDPTLSNFLSEVVEACELQLFRSAIVMSWLAAMYQLQTLLIENHLSEFNREMKQIQEKWKPIKRQDQLGKLRESEQLDRMCSVGLFDASIKKELGACLDRRNNCGHPTRIRYGSQTVKHHIEVLLQNVFLNPDFSPAG